MRPWSRRPALRTQGSSRPYPTPAARKAEEKLLTSPATDLGEIEDFTPEIAQALNFKCVAALTEAYARDTAGRDKNVAVVWRDKNGELHRESHSVIAGIVQNWYLSVGRAQEKKVGGCLSIVVVGVSIALLWILSIA